MDIRRIDSKHDEERGMVLDGTKIQWHGERVEAWLRGEKIAPITIDMALTQACDYRCEFCYGQLQKNPAKKITWDVMSRFLDEVAEIGVKAVSLVSDGESSLSPIYPKVVVKGSKNGLSMAMASHGCWVTRDKLEQILPHLTYFRFNISAGEPKRYAQIHGVPEPYFYRVCQNIRDAMQIKREKDLKVTIGLQMVLMPQYGDQILPLAKLGQELKPDYLVIKHCSDDEKGSLGVDYTEYTELYDILKEAEALSTDEYTVKVKWSKIQDEGKRRYIQCYGPLFLLQLSGSGLVAPCGMLFGEGYRRYWVGNIVDTPFKEIWLSERYWEVMNELASPRFDARTMCGCLCVQHKVNEYLWDLKRSNAILEEPQGEPPGHINFV